MKRAYFFIFLLWAATGIPAVASGADTDLRFEQDAPMPTAAAGSGKTTTFTSSMEYSLEISDELTIDVLNLQDMDLMDVFKLLSEKTGLNIISGPGISGRVTIFLKNIKLRDVLRIILDANGLAYAVEDGVVRIMSAVDFERRYGYAFGAALQTQIVRLYYADTAAVTGVLTQLKSPEGKIVSEVKSNTLVLIDSPAKLPLMQAIIAEMDVPRSVRVFELSYAQVEDIAEKITGNLSAAGTLQLDVRSNKLIVTDTDRQLDRIERVVDAIDVRQEQVLIEAKIIQVNLSDQTKYGIDWEALISHNDELRLNSSFNILSGDKGATMKLGALSTDDYTVLLEALQTVGVTDILSSPRITAVNGKEAKILVGSTEPYVTSTVTTPSSGPVTTAESVNFIDVGVKLFVTPRIHKDRFITMEIKPEISSLTRYLVTSTNNSIPVVETSEAETTVTVKDGVTIVIGGLIKQDKIVTDNKVPLLGDIPLVGYAFRNSDNVQKKTEIVVFLTPRIITGDVPYPVP